MSAYVPYRGLFSKKIILKGSPSLNFKELNFVHYGEFEDWNIVMINTLKQLVRTRTDIKLQPREYSFLHAIAM